MWPVRAGRLNPAHGCSSAINAARKTFTTPTSIVWRMRSRGSEADLVTEKWRMIQGLRRIGPRVLKANSPVMREYFGGQGRDRTGDLPLFRRTLIPTELPGRKASCASPWWRP
jgi:hypothetical protein